MRDAAKWTSLVLLLLVFPGALRAAKRQPQHLVMKVHSFKDCGEARSYVRFHDAEIITRRDGGHAVNVNATINKDITSLKRHYGFEKVEMDVSRCRDRQSSDTCEHFTTFKWSAAICHLLTSRDPGSALAPIISAFDPPIACPVRKGHYTVTNASWDFDSQLVRRMLQNYYWFGTARAWDQDNYNCACANGALESAAGRNPPKTE